MLTAGDWQDIHQRHAPACEQCDDGRHSAIHLSCRQQIWSCPSDRLGHSAASNRRQQLHSRRSVSPSHDSSHTLVMSIRPAGSQCCHGQSHDSSRALLMLSAKSTHTRTTGNYTDFITNFQKVALPAYDDWDDDAPEMSSGLGRGWRVTLSLTSRSLALMSRLYDWINTKY